MKIEIGMRVARQLKGFGGEGALAIAAIDELKEYNKNFDELGYVGAQRKLTDKQRLLLGIAWSEFLVSDNGSPDNDKELCRASKVAGMVRENLEINDDVFFTLLNEL